MAIYLDASVLVAYFSTDPSTERAEAFLDRQLPSLIVSDFAATEFASALARRVRMHWVDVKAARSIFALFDEWTGRSAQMLETTNSDISKAAAFVRRLDLNLRAPDAINIAIAQRVGAQLATFDDGMVVAAKALKVAVAPM